MIYDANAWVGHWPFRSLPERSAADLLRRMDKLGIAKALVASLHGLLYKDAHEANHELAKEISRHRDRLFPAAVVNPAYDGWRRDLKQCREEFGIVAVRLVPDYHGYALSGPLAQELVAEAVALKMAPTLCWRVVDPRGRHRLDPGREAELAEVKSLLGQFKDAQFLMHNFRGPIEGLGDKPKCLYDITLLMGRNGLRMGEEIAKHGAGRFAVGTAMLLQSGSAPLIGLEKCPLNKRDREAVEWRNLARLVPEMK